MLQEGQAVEFAESVERMLKHNLGVPEDAEADEEDFGASEEDTNEEQQEEVDAEPDHDEL